MDFTTGSSSHGKDHHDILDMVTADMDFEQAFMMYNSLQQKQAQSSIEQLQKVQMLNQSYIPETDHQHYGSHDFSDHRSQILNTQTYPTSHRFDAEDDEDDDMEEHNEFDQFFSNTEANALDSFLDNLTNSTNPLQFYNIGGSSSHTHQELPIFDLHTMKEQQKVSVDHENLRQELTDAFSHPSLKGLNLNSGSSSSSSSSSSLSSSTNINPHNNDSDMLTPPSSDVESKRFRSGTLGVIDGTPIKKKRRSSTKPLLSLEQKRLNHSHSEQKRRQLCKLAYQRCLNLIIDIDAFNKLPELNEAERKSKRARINKEGLPNLSKHNALVRISNEMLLIKGMNEKLAQLIERS
ncbi:uncharacterized protein RJT21DRAFT_109437 [Scheffersomyces amazonensis]|uniref:uncharacterized protein n=1 Tax=Scheffersomyces amazonensis TaxID=1078765 RepID=UPI00315CF884